MRNRRKVTLPIRDGAQVEALGQMGRERPPTSLSTCIQPTEVRFECDDDAVYLGARMYLSLGAAMAKPLLSLIRREPMKHQSSIAWGGHRP